MVRKREYDARRPGRRLSATTVEPYEQKDLKRDKKEIKEEEFKKRHNNNGNSIGKVNRREERPREKEGVNNPLHQSKEPATSEL